MPRQLNFFKSNRQKGERLPAPIEYRTHCALADTIRRWLMPQWRFTHIPLGEYRSIATAARLKRMGVTPGWPDFVFAGPEGRTFWMELKRARGALSDAQIEIRDHLKECGFDYAMVDSFDTAIQALVSRGIVRSMVVQ